jgi:signal transduction histidine kinase
MAEGAISESRDAIQCLRSQPASQGDLAELLTVAGQDLAHSDEANGSRVSFRVTAEGERRDLDPHLRDEAYRIARELLRNAFRHARARHIEVENRYDDRLFRIRIRDDGKGIEPDTLKSGSSAGHWGLPGVRERAKRIDAQLTFWSGAGAGTEVELNIPSSVTSSTTRRSRRFHLLRKKGNS